MTVKLTISLLVKDENALKCVLSTREDIYKEVAPLEGHEGRRKSWQGRKAGANAAVVVPAQETCIHILARAAIRKLLSWCCV